MNRSARFFRTGSGTGARLATDQAAHHTGGVPDDIARLQSAYIELSVLATRALAGDRIESIEQRAQTIRALADGNTALASAAASVVDAARHRSKLEAELRANEERVVELLGASEIRERVARKVNDNLERRMATAITALEAGDIDEALASLRATFATAEKLRDALEVE